MAFIREGLHAYVQELLQDRLYSPYAMFRPMMTFMGLVSQETRTRLGRPNTAAVFGSLEGLGRAAQAQIGHSHAIFDPYQKTEPNDGETIEYRGATPTAANFSEDNAGMLETRWVDYREPMKIGGHALDFATGPSQVMSILENATNITFERLIKRINDDLLDGTLTAAQQNENIWSAVLGLDHYCTADNTIGRVSRTAETNLQPITVDATSQLSSTAIKLDLIDYINHGGNPSGTAIAGRAPRSPNGRGCNLHIVHPKLWQPLREEAEGRYSIEIPKAPGNVDIGAMNPAIRYSGSWITYDENVTNTEMLSTCIEEWMMEVDPRHNFSAQPFKRKSENEEGGEYYDWSSINATVRLRCRRPWMNAKTTGLTVS